MMSISTAIPLYCVGQYVSTVFVLIHLVGKWWTCPKVDPEGGGGGTGGPDPPPPLKNHKNIGFLSNTDRIP